MEDHPHGVHDQPGADREDHREDRDQHQRQDDADCPPAPARPAGEQARRRVFTGDFKLAILAEYDRCTEPGEKGALLRREGLYSSLITDWRRQHREGSLVATPGRSEGGRGGPSRSEVARLRAENEALKRKLAKAEGIITDEPSTGSSPTP